MVSYFNKPETTYISKTNVKPSSEQPRTVVRAQRISPQGIHSYARTLGLASCNEMLWGLTADAAYEDDVAIMALPGTSDKTINPDLPTPASHVYIMRAKLISDSVKKPRLKPGAEVQVAFGHGLMIKPNSFWEGRVMKPNNFSDLGSLMILVRRVYRDDEPVNKDEIITVKHLQDLV